MNNWCAIFLAFLGGLAFSVTCLSTHEHPDKPGVPHRNPLCTRKGVIPWPL